MGSCLQSKLQSTTMGLQPGLWRSEVLVGRLGSPAKEGLRAQSQGDAGWDGKLRKTLQDPNTCMPVDVAHRTEKAGAELNDWQEKEQGLLVLSSLC